MSIVDWRGADQLWPAIDTAYRRMTEVAGQVRPATSLAARQVDGAQPAGHRPYINAHRLLVIAHENHRAFLALIQATNFEPHAPFNLLRPVLEHSLWVLWLMDPRQSAERRRRGLHFEILDHRAEQAYLKDMGRLPNGERFRDMRARRDTTAGDSYRRDAEALGLDYAKLGKPINLTDEIPKLSSIIERYGQDWAYLIVTEWRRLSGYQHGKVWASLASSDRTHTVEVEGGHEAVLSASDDAIYMAVSTSGLCLLEALRLYTSRCTTPA